MSLTSQQIKMGIARTLLRLMPLIVMGVLTLMTYWLVEKTSPPEAPTQERIRLHEPDYIIKNGTLSALNELGNTKHRILADKLTHYDDDASMDFDIPRMRLFQPNKAPVTVKADTGHMDGDVSVLELFNNAFIFRPAQAATETEPANLRMLATSSYFKVLINDDIIETNRPITLEQGTSIMNSNDGGIFNNIQQSMTLSGQVKGRIERAPKGVQ
jgi:lipopolysaccharide export system protein LptC